MSAIAIIPARGGSKRIPGKNKKLFLGKPIIAYSIQAAIASGLFDEVMVSTDDAEIAEIAKKNGANVPFLRSSKNANDFAVLADVVTEVLSNYREKGILFAQACCLLPTAPFISAQKLIEAQHKLNNNSHEVVFPIVEFSFPIQRSLKINDGNVKMVWPQNLNTRSQDLEKRFHDAGQFYFLKVAAFLEQSKIHLKNAGGIIIGELAAQDIDTLEDWEIAELKYKLLLKK